MMILFSIMLNKLKKDFTIQNLNSYYAKCLGHYFEYNVKYM